MRGNLSAFMMYALAMGWMSGPGIRERDPLEGIDIPSEYALIQKKKSVLSANMRRAVVYRYERFLESKESREES